MIKKLLDEIKKYNTIIIHRHDRPDLDALGSQIGLKLVLKDNYPEKNIYAVGDESKRYSFVGKMDNIDDSLYNDALVIIVDVAVESLVSDKRYKNAKEIFIIDHHNNNSDISNNWICDTSKIAAAELIAKILMDNNFKISSEAATAFYGGIITDSGRFLYGSRLDETFIIASKLISLGADAKYIYDNIYVEPLEKRRMSSYFSQKFVVEDGVAYLKNTSEVFEMFNVDFQDVSRGMVSVMAGIDEISIWLNFTEDKINDKIVGEFRSRKLPIVEIAKSFGGGGHSLACGAPFKTWDEVDKAILVFKKYLKENS